MVDAKNSELGTVNVGVEKCSSAFFGYSGDENRPRAEELSIRQLFTQSQRSRAMGIFGRARLEIGGSKVHCPKYYYEKDGKGH